MPRYASDIRKSPEWQAVEQRFIEMSGINTGLSSSIVGMNPTHLGITPEEFDRGMMEILDVCPQFYPVWFVRGEYMLRIGNTDDGEHYTEKALNYVGEIVDDEEEYSRILFQKVEILEKLLRYDLAAKYMERAIRIFPENASFYDELAFYQLKLPKPDLNGALRMQLRALELEPDDEQYINNLGWVYLMREDYQRAEEHFERALSYDPDIPGGLANRDTCEYMQEHRISYYKFLLRPADREEIKDLLDDRDFEEAEELRQSYNNDRIEAFKIHHLQNKTFPTHDFLDMLQYIGNFMQSVEQSLSGEEKIFLYENARLINQKARTLFCYFIMDADMMDEQLLKDTAEAVREFYDFLCNENLVPTEQYQQLATGIKDLTGDLSWRVEKYLHLRHDVTLEEDEREEAIARLFDL